MGGLKKGQGDSDALPPALLDYESPQRRERWPFELFISWCVSSFVAFAGLALWLSVAVAAAEAAAQARTIFPLLLAIAYCGLGICCVLQGVVILREYSPRRRAAAIAGFSVSAVMWVAIVVRLVVGGLQL